VYCHLFYLPFTWILWLRLRMAGYDLAVLRSENTSDKKSIVHNLSLKEDFCGVYIRKKG